MRKIGGIKVTNGKILRKCKFRLIRFEETIKEDLEILAMKHFKEDVSEITKGNEGGISFINFTDI
jgi:translation initiation factor IF-2